MAVSQPFARSPAKTGAEPLKRPGRSVWRYVMLTLRVVQVRLRFWLVLILAFVVVGKWDLLRNYWERLTRGSGGIAAPTAVSTDTEYFCPMCPGVLSDWPSKCPVCNMALVRRKKGEAVPLPDGVVARMQFSPYRMQLAGIQTSPVTYQPLVQEIVTVGFVDSFLSQPRTADLPRPSTVCVKAEVFDKDSLFLKPGQRVEASSDAAPGQTFVGQVRELATQFLADRSILQLRFELDNPRQELRPGMLVTARVKVPVTQSDILARLLAEDGRNRAILDILMHSLFTLDGFSAESGLQGLTRSTVQQVLTRQGLALAVPESVVVDTGSRKVVYVESGPGMFDGVEVTLGPRCGEFYPVLRGLQAGQRVATAGSFLIDAETRLNPSIAASYFGATRGSSSEGERAPTRSPARPSDEAANSAALRQLSPADQALAAKQRLCPVTGQPLGSMGVPTRVVVEGRVVFLCCASCEAELKRNPNKYLAKLPDK